MVRGDWPRLLMWCDSENLSLNRTRVFGFDCMVVSFGVLAVHTVYFIELDDLVSAFESVCCL